MGLFLFQGQTAPWKNSQKETRELVGLLTQTCRLSSLVPKIDGCPPSASLLPRPGSLWFCLIPEIGISAERGRRFGIIDDVKTNSPKVFHKKLSRKDHWEKCVNRGGDYYFEEEKFAYFLSWPRIYYVNCIFRWTLLCALKLFYIRKSRVSCKILITPTINKGKGKLIFVLPSGLY